METPWIHQYDSWFKPSMSYPELTLYETVARTANRFPDHPALSFMGRKITYSELMSEIDQAAAGLEADGFSTGQVMTICLPNIPQAVIVFYAVNRLGGICNMVHPLTPPDELSHYIRTTGSDYLTILDAFLFKHHDILSHSRIRQVYVCSVMDYLSPLLKVGFYLKSGRKIKAVPQRTLYKRWKIMMNGLEPRPYQRRRGAHDCAVYLHSGGTTGSPKTIMLSSYNFNVLAAQGPQIVGIRDLDNFNPLGLSMVTILPLFHGFGLCMGMHTMMAIGLMAILVPQFSPDILADVIIKERPSYIAAVPTLFEGMLKNEKLKKADLSCLTAVFCGGDTLPSELKRRFDSFLRERGSQCTLREGYGLTETVTVCAVNPMTGARENSIGLPLADVLMKVIRPGSFETADPNEDGEFCIHAPTVMLGYLDDPEATDETIRLHPDGRKWVHTGDYGTMGPDGYFYFKQRIKRIVKVSGIQVFPSQIEDEISKVAGVRMACAIGVPHPYQMQAIKAFVVPDDPAADQNSLRQAILRHCEQTMLKYAIPREIEFCDDLPRTKVGKVDFVALERIELEKRSVDDDASSDSA